MKSSAELTFEINKPIVCTAIHSGSYLSDECRNNLAIDSEIEFREEDPSQIF